MSTRPSFQEALSQITPLLQAEKHPEALLQGVVDFLFEVSPDYSWVGIYLLDGEELVLAAWQGHEVTEHARIPVSRGVCGLAARAGMVVNVPDVSEDPRYLMCFPSTRSELVVPILGSGGVLGEIDIDSDELAAFRQEDEAFLKAVAERLAKILESMPP